MSKPDSGSADKESNQPEGESAAVRARTYPASEQDTADAETTEPVEGEAPEPKETRNTLSNKGTNGSAAATSDDAQGGEKPKPVRPTRAKRRVRRPRTQPKSVDVEDISNHLDEKSSEDEAKEPADATPDAQDSGEAAAATSDDPEVVVEETEAGEEAEKGEEAEEGEPAKAKRRVSKSQVIAYGLLPGLALLSAPAVGFLKWQDSSVRESQIARVESVAAAKDSTIALLSYKVDSVEKDLDAAKSRLTGTFKDSYSQLIKDVVIPGAKKGHISTTATVPAAASVSANPNHAVALLFVNQSAVVDKEQPSDTSSAVRVTLDKVDGRWLISGFDPV